MMKVKLWAEVKPSGSNHDLEHITWLLLNAISPAVNEAMNRVLERTERDNADKVLGTQQGAHTKC